MDVSLVRNALARAQAANTHPGSTAFSANVARLMERVEYRRCESGEDIEAIYRLRYKAYRANDFVPASASRMTTDQFDEAPNCYRFGVYIDSELVSTVRVHHVTREQPYSPIMGVFEDIIAPRLERGESFINPTLLAADPAATSVYHAIPYITLRLAVVANAYFDTTNCICVIREDHAAFYRRTFGAVQVGEPRAYPPFTVPVMLYDSDCSINMQPTVARYPFFESELVEQRLLFGKLHHPSLAPLTILPTNRYRHQKAA